MSITAPGRRLHPSGHPSRPLGSPACLHPPWAAHRHSRRPLLGGDPPPLPCCPRPLRSWPACHLGLALAPLSRLPAQWPRTSGQVPPCSERPRGLTAPPGATRVTSPLASDSSLPSLAFLSAVTWFTRLLRKLLMLLGGVKFCNLPQLTSVASKMSSRPDAASPEDADAVRSA